MQELKFYPNPFVALGPDGMPCGRVYYVNHPRPNAVMGGTLAKKRVDREDGERHSKKERDAARRLDRRDARIRGVADVRMRPMAQPASQYVKERIGSGDLIAADKRTAEICGIPAKAFQAPVHVLRSYLQDRITEWTAINGEPPAIAAYEIVQNGDDIALVAKDPATAPPSP